MNPSSTADSAAAFALPGFPIDRESAEGWSQWRRSRHTFQPAPSIDFADYQSMNPRDRMLHDLHRAATHANLALQETPMSAVVSRLMRSRIQSNALKHKPTTRAGLMITGGGYQGKRETVCETAAVFEDFWLDLHQHANPTAVPGTRDFHIPVAYVQTPVTATPKSVCEAILTFFGARFHRATLPQLIRAVRTSLHGHGTKVLLLDDITRLKMHREADQDVLDLLRSLMSMNVTLVLVGVGIRQSGLLRDGHIDPRTGQWVFRPLRTARSFNDEAATQTERRFDLVDLSPFRYDTPADISAWTGHLVGLEQQLRLFRSQPGMLTQGAMPEYLFQRTNGIVGLLERLIEDACTEAIDTGTERLTLELLETIALSLGDTAARDPSAGEIPDVRQPTRKSAKPAKRGRNTVFDDKGSPAACEG